MRFLLASGILPPEIGGPANYVRHLAEELRIMGHQVTAMAYGAPAKLDGVRTLGIGRSAIRALNLIRYCMAVLKTGRYSDLIMTFDLMSAGLPTVMANLVMRKRVILRLGGDFFWERDINRGRVFCTLEEYYRKGPFKRGPAFFVARFLLQRCGLLIFSTPFLEGLYLSVFPGLKGRTTVIRNPYPEVKADPVGGTAADGPKRFLFVGRLTRLKNLRTLLDIFHELSETRQDVRLDIYGDGPERAVLERVVSEKGLDRAVRIERGIPHGEVLKRIESSHACILPSLSEVSPNFGLECLKLMKPLIITKYNGLPEVFGRYAVQVDPLDPREIRERIIELLDGKGYPPRGEGMDDGDMNRTWRDVAGDILEAVNHVRSSVGTSALPMGRGLP